MKKPIWMKLAYLMPRKLVYWCSIRLIANATQGKWSKQILTELTAMDALQRWENGTQPTMREQTEPDAPEPEEFNCKTTVAHGLF